jgi:hypothetical protein
VDVDERLLTETALELCRRPSMRPHERAVAEYLGGRLDRLGFDVELQEVVADRPNVIAVARGDPGRRSFLFNGHSDMPPPVPGWSRDPFWSGPARRPRSTAPASGRPSRTKARRSPSSRPPRASTHRFAPT